MRCFKKVRIKKKKKNVSMFTKAYRLMDKRAKAHKEQQNHNEEEIKEGEARQNLYDLVNNFEIIEKDNFSSGFWKLKNKYLFPKR